MKTTSWPFFRNRFETANACSSSPPGLSRMSRMKALAPSRFSSRSAFSSSRSQSPSPGPAGRRLVEVREPDVADVAADHERVRHRVQRDRVADHGELERLVVALAHDRDLDRRALRPAQPLDRVVDAHAARVLGLDPADHVAGADPEPVRRRALEGRHHGDVAVHRLHRDPEAVVLALLALLHRLVVALLEEVRVRVERAQELADRARDQPVARHVLDELGLHGVQHRGVEAQLLVEPPAARERALPEHAPRERRPQNQPDGYGPEPRKLHEGIIAIRGKRNNARKRETETDNSTRPGLKGGASAPPCPGVRT